MNNFKTLKDHVYDYIADQILNGEIETGEKINENKICEALSVSRTPVREALIELSCNGILENIPRKGFVAKKLTLNSLAELYAVIGVLDGMAAAQALPNLTEKDFKDMEYYTDIIDVAIRSENYEMYHKQQAEFHQTYLKKCGNEVLIETITNLKSKILLKGYSKAANPDIQQILSSTNEEHKEFVRIMRSGNSAAAAEYLSKVHWNPEQAKFDLF